MGVGAQQLLDARQKAKGEEREVQALREQEREEIERLRRDNAELVAALKDVERQLDEMKQTHDAAVVAKAERLERIRLELERQLKDHYARELAELNAREPISRELHQKLHEFHESSCSYESSGEGACFRKEIRRLCVRNWVSRYVWSTKTWRDFFLIGYSNRDISVPSILPPSQSGFSFMLHQMYESLTIPSRREHGGPAPWNQRKRLGGSAHRPAPPVIHPSKKSRPNGDEPNGA